MIGTTLAHYRITAELGAGGMGEVWRATDEKLGRDVALKVLSEEFAEDAERLERFEREARAVAALNHPHIVTIYSVEESEGMRFLTMELINGKSLDRLIPKGGLEFEKFFELATPLAEAISAAHDKSVVHRDLKPSNVMVDGDGRIKVLDFGLAKLQEAGDVSDSSELPTEALTGVGMIVGTVPYMSPEQIESKIVDHRTDIFSLGVLLYEMATGDRPFQGDSQPALMSSILRDVPQSVLEVRDDVPRHLGRIIGRCLEKDRRDRYQTARDVFNELKALRRESSTGGHTRSPLVSSVPVSSRPVSSRSEVRRSDVPWIAVLPLKAQGSDPELDTFADGLGEDITTGLSRFPHLFVISRNSAMQYSGRSLDVRAVGRELGARYALEGAVRKAGSAVRVSVQLLDAATGTHLWAETYDRDLARAGIFNVQDEITDRVVATVADPYGVLVRAMAVAVRDRPVEELSAKELALRFCAYWHQIRPDEHARLRTALEGTVEGEPTNAEAWACLSRLYSNEHGFRLNPLPESVERARRAARRAVEIDPTCQLAWEALAEASYFARDLGTFRNAAERAMELNPRNTSTMALMGVLISHGGEWDRGIGIMRRSMELNPHHPGWYHFPQFFDHYRRREFDQALEMAKRLNMPEDFWVHAVIAAASGRLGRKEEARAALETLRSLLPGYRDELGPTLGMWILDAAVVDQLMEGVAEAEALVGEQQHAAPISAAKPTSGSRPGTVGIAVLPFADMSPTKDQDYFCEGMAEEIMNALVHVDGIQVASRTSAFRAVEEGKDLQSIGRALSVGQVLEGSVRMAGNRLRVTAQLTEVESGYQLWSERFDREAEDVFAIQDEIAAGVVEAVTSRLDSGVRTVLAREQVGNLEAYQLYLKGRHYRYSKNDHANALKSFEEAVTIDAEHAPSWIGRAEVTVLAAVYSLIPAHEAFQTAKDSLATAVGLQGESAEGRYVEGMIAFCEARWRDAEAVLRRAIEIQPTFVQAHCWLGFLLSVHHRRYEAEMSFAAACEIDPLAPYPYAMTACGQLALGRPRQAIAPADQAMTFEHENTLALYCSGIAKVAMGEFDEGVEELETAARHSRRGAFILGIFGWGLAAAGRRDEAEAVLEELRSRPKPAPTAVSEAWILAAFGDVEGAWKVLDRAEEESQPILCFAGMPPFDRLRRDPRFSSLLQRLGLPPSPSVPEIGPAVDTVEVPDKSIAVLPFVNRSGNPDDECFSDGLSEELINALNRVSDLKVAARSSAFQFRGQELDVREVGRKLDVATVLEGSVRISGSRLRITTELVNCVDGYQIWSEKFDREITDIFDTQDEIAGAIVEQLHMELGAKDKDLIVAKRTENMEAYRSYLLGQHLRYAKEDHGGAVRAFQEAVRLDPTHAPSWTGLAESLALSAHMSLIPAREACAAAREALSTALELQGESADGLHGEAFVAFIERRWGALEAAVRRAIELQPAHVPSLGLLGMCLSLHQKPNEAEHFFERARQADPLASFPYMLTALGLLTAGKPQEAHLYAEQALTFEKEDASALFCSSLANVALGHFEEGIAAAELGVAVSHRGADFLGLLGWALASAGREDEARTLLEELRTRPAAAPQIVSEGWLLGALGEIDAAFEVFARAEDQHQLWLYYTGLPGFDPLRADPRFAELEDRLGLPPSPSVPDVVPVGTTIEVFQKSIAVLPFVNMSDDRENEFFSDGVTEEILTSLSKVGGLHVISRTSAMTYKGTSKPIRDISSELGVGSVLEGSVRRVGDRVRVTAQLIEAATDRQVWNESYDRDLEDIFAIQSDVAEQIAQALRTELAPEVVSQIRQRPTEDMAAYDLYLQGRQGVRTLRAPEILRGIGQLEEAISLDPDFSAAHAELALAHLRSAYWGAVRGREDFDDAREAADRALELDPANAVALVSRAGVRAIRDFDWDGAVDDFGDAIRLDPNEVEAHHWLGMTLFLMRRFDDAVAAQETALSMDPHSPNVASHLGLALCFAGRPEEGLRVILDGVDHHPVFFDFPNFLAIVLKRQNRFDEAAKWYDRTCELTGRHPIFEALHASSLRLAGKESEAEAVIERLKASADDPSADSLARAAIAVAERDLEAAMRHLREAADRRLPLICWFRPSLHDLELPPDDPGVQELWSLLWPEEYPADPTAAEATASVGAKSIAVLPFTNMSGDADNEYFSDGLTEEVIADLAGIKALSVISRTSAMLFKGTDKDLPTIARELSVRYVLEGGVRKAGSSLRITAQLVDAQKDTPLWSEKYSGTLDDVFEVQERVSREIVCALDVTLTSDENQRLAERPIADPRAFELYLQARQEVRRFEVNALDRAATLLSQAVEIEGETPPILSLMAQAKVAQVKAGGNPDLRQLDEVESQALALLEQSPDLPQAHALLGSLGYERGQLPEAVWHCKRALEGNPNDADALLYLGASYMAAGQMEEGLDAGRRMVACDPLASISWMILGAAYWFVDSIEDSLPDLERSLELDPQNFLSQWAIGYTYTLLGRLTEAERHAAFFDENEPENPYGRQLRSLVDALEGRHEAALEVLAEVDLTPLDPHNTFHLSESFAMAGDTSRALEVLESAVDQGFYPYPYINEFCPFMAPLRSMPEFAGILEKSKEKTEAFREDGPLKPLTDDAQRGTK